MNDVSQITDNLFISSFLDGQSIDYFKKEDFRLIISMIGATIPHEDLSKTGCQILFLRARDNFLFPIASKTLLKGVETALPVIKQGHKVLVYCRQGKRRSVTMVASILIALGYSADDAMKLIKDQRVIADPYRWYVKKRIHKFEQTWKNIKNV